MGEMVVEGRSMQVEEGANPPPVGRPAQRQHTKNVKHSHTKLSYKGKNHEKMYIYKMQIKMY